MEVKTIAILALVLSIIAIILATFSFAGTSEGGIVPLGPKIGRASCRERV